MTAASRARPIAQTVGRPPPACPVCGAQTEWLDVVDFHKSCHALDPPLPLSGHAVFYAQCLGCDFSFAPALYEWSAAEFGLHVYNADYPMFDPDYASVRPARYAKAVTDMLGSQGAALRHLDYGGGEGVLSRLLADAGWNSQSYDPYAGGRAPDGTYDLVTAFEVFEHVPRPRELVAELARWVRRPGMILFSTLLSDDNLLGLTPIQSWWYASPRNGHISLFSEQSLQLLAASQGWAICSFSQELHCFVSGRPEWAMHLFR